MTCIDVSPFEPWNTAHVWLSIRWTWSHTGLNAIQLTLGLVRGRHFPKACTGGIHPRFFGLAYLSIGASLQLFLADVIATSDAAYIDRIVGTRINLKVRSEPIVFAAEESSCIHFVHALWLLPNDAGGLYSFHWQLYGALEPILGCTGPRTSANNDVIGGDGLNSPIGCISWLVTNSAYFSGTTLTALLGVDPLACAESNLNLISRLLQHALHEFFRRNLRRVIPESQGADGTNTAVEPAGNQRSELGTLPGLLGPTLAAEARSDTEDR